MNISSQLFGRGKKALGDASKRRKTGIGRSVSETPPGGPIFAPLPVELNMAQALRISEQYRMANTYPGTSVNRVRRATTPPEHLEAQGRIPPSSVTAPWQWSYASETDDDDGVSPRPRTQIPIEQHVTILNVEETLLTSSE